MELRVDAAIDLGYVIGADGKQVKIYTPEGLNILGNIIEGNEDSCNKDFYGSLDTFGRKILGYNLEPKSYYQIVPSALESFASCMRDPAFYRLYKRINHFYMRLTNFLTAIVTSIVLFLINFSVNFFFPEAKTYLRRTMCLTVVLFAGTMLT